MILGFDGSRAFVKDKTGTENYSFQLLRALSKLDSHNQYIIYLRSITHPGSAWQGWPANFQFKVIGWPRLWTQVGLAKQTFKDKLDVLFIPAHTSPLIHRPGLKTVVTVHDLGAEYLPRHHQLKQTLYLKWITKFQLKTATKLIAVSRATKQDLVKKIKCDPQKIQVIYEGYDEKLFKIIKGDRLVNTSKHYDIEAGKYFLFVGTVQPRKNLKRLIEAFWGVARLVAKNRSATKSTNSHGLALGSLITQQKDNHEQNIKINSPNFLADSDFTTPDLVIVGSKGWLSEDIYKLPRKLGIEDKVKFLGHVDNRDLPALYSGAIALTYPSLFEGFGLPILEAQACGCPVITSNTSSMPEVAGKGAIYIDPYSVNDIVRGMERIKGKGERGKLVEAGFKNIKRFSWRKCAEETLDVLENI